MKRTMLMAALAALVGVMPAAAAQAAKPTASSHAKASAVVPAAKATATKSHVMRGEFVSYDAQTKMITVKEKSGTSSVSPVEGKAITEAASLKAGDQVALTMNDKSVTAIRAMKAGKAKAKAKTQAKS